MEPRAYKEWGTRERRFNYLGGVGDYDLWVDDDNDVRVVIIGKRRWTYFRPSEPKYPPDWWGSDFPTVTKEGAQDILTYVKLFVPDVWHVMQEAQDGAKSV